MLHEIERNFPKISSYKCTILEMSRNIYRCFEFCIICWKHFFRIVFRARVSMADLQPKQQLLSTLLWLLNFGFRILPRLHYQPISMCSRPPSMLAPGRMFWNSRAHRTSFDFWWLSSDLQLNNRLSMVDFRLDGQRMRSLQELPKSWWVMPRLRFGWKAMHRWRHDNNYTFVVVDTSSSKR